jgi:hypothetical protein
MTWYENYFVVRFWSYWYQSMNDYRYTRVSYDLWVYVEDW